MKYENIIVDTGTPVWINFMYLVYGTHAS